MRKMIFIVMTLLMSLIGFSQQVSPTQKPIVEKVQVYDSTIVQDTKLMIVANSLYGQNGLVKSLIRQVSVEQSDSGKVIYLDETQRFVDNLNKCYQDYLKNFLNIDTSFVDPLAINKEIQELANWQQTVLNDSIKKSSTSLTVWSEKSSRLEKLQRYRNQIK